MFASATTGTWRVLAVLALLVGLAACDVRPSPSATVHYRMTLRLLVDRQPVSASVVHSVKMAGNSWPGGPVMLLQQDGEALVLDLHERGVLVLPLLRAKSENVDDMFVTACDFFGQTSDVTRVIALAKAFDGSCPLSPENRPVFVRMDSASHPETMAVVSPERLSEAFGAGVSFVSLELSSTADEVTRTIRSVMPWIEPTQKPPNVTFFDVPAGDRKIQLGMVHFL